MYWFYSQIFWVLLPLFDRPCFALFWFNRKMIQQACRVEVGTDKICHTESKTNIANITNVSSSSSLCFVWFNWALSFLSAIKQVASYSRLNLDGSSIVPNESLRQIKLISTWAKKVIRAIPTHIRPMNQDFWQSKLGGNPDFTTQPVPTYIARASIQTRPGPLWSHKDQFKRVLLRGMCLYKWGIFFQI